MIKVNLYSAKGLKKGNFSLPRDYSEKINLDLLAQALRVYENRVHPGLARVKTRGEVRLSTRKIYRQKGTGRARHGAKSAPIFVGGGVAHGPKGIKKQLILPGKMRQKSLKAALSLKAKNGNLAVVSLLSSLKKTKEAEGLLKKINSAGNASFTIVVGSQNKSVVSVLRNLDKVRVEPYSNLNAYIVFNGGTILMDKEIFATSKKAANKVAGVKKGTKKRS
jgi:large subunit ribosomal protein L4